MASEAEAHNKAAADIAQGTTVEDPFFGTVTLGPKNEEATASPESEGWDMYVVQHSGFNHCWSSASVVAGFRRDVSK